MKISFQKISISVLFLLFVAGCQFPFQNTTKVTETPKYILELQGKSSKQRMKIAKNTQDQDILQELSRSDNEGIRSDVAKNKYLSVSLQRYLLNDEHWMVKNYLGANPGLDGEVAKTLSESNDPRIRWTVARNPSTPESVLNTLVDDESPQVLLKLIHNPSLSEESLLRMAKTAPATVILELLKKREVSEAVMGILRERNDTKINEILFPSESPPEPSL